MATYRSTLPIPADIITFRLSEKLVYVKPADNYEQALNLAQKEFPEELGHVPRERISFSIFANMNKERKQVRISESAWFPTIARMLRGEVIDIRIQPDSLEEDAPPMYLEVPRIYDEKTLRNSRSAPSSRASSRNRQPSPTPSAHSHKSRGIFGLKF